MTLPAFPVHEALSKSDEVLGAYMLAWYIGAVADPLGIDPNVSGFAAVTQNLLTVEARHAATVAWEKALHLAARLEFDKAGKLFRELLWDGAHEIKLRELAEVGARRMKQSAEWARKGWKGKQAESRQIHKLWEAEARKIIAKRTQRKPSYRELANGVAKVTGDKFETVRKYLASLKILGK